MLDFIRDFKFVSVFIFSLQKFANIGVFTRVCYHCLLAQISDWFKVPLVQNLNAATDNSGLEVLERNKVLGM